MVWTESAPAATGSGILSENAKVVANWPLLQTTINVDHFAMADPVSDYDGEHKQITLVNVTKSGKGVPTSVAEKGFLYTDGATTDVELYYKDADGNDVQITDGGATKFDSPVKAWANTGDDGIVADSLALTCALTSTSFVYTFSGITMADTKYAINITENGTDIPAANSGARTVVFSAKTTAGFTFAFYTTGSGVGKQAVDHSVNIMGAIA